MVACQNGSMESMLEWQYVNMLEWQYVRMVAYVRHTEVLIGYCTHPMLPILIHDSILLHVNRQHHSVCCSSGQSMHPLEILLLFHLHLHCYFLISTISRSRKFQLGRFGNRSVSQKIQQRPQKIVFAKDGDHQDIVFHPFFLIAKIWTNLMINLKIQNQNLQLIYFQYFCLISCLLNFSSFLVAGLKGWILQLPLCQRHLMLKCSVAIHFNLLALPLIS